MNFYTCSKIDTLPMTKQEDLARLRIYTHQLYNTATGVACGVVGANTFFVFQQECCRAMKKEDAMVAKEVHLPGNMVMRYENGEVTVFRVKLECVMNENEIQENDDKEDVCRAIKRRRL